MARLGDTKSYPEKCDGPKEFRALYALGVPAVPLMIDKMQQSPDEAYPLANAVERITQKVFAANEYPVGKVGDLHEEAKLYLAWWATGRKDVRAKFDKFYADLKAAKKDGDNVISMDETIYDNVNKKVTIQRNSLTPFGEAYTGIENLGVDVLPIIFEKVQANDYDLLTIFSDLTGGKGHFNGKVEKRAMDLVNWWGKNKDKWLLPAAQ